MVKVIYYFRYNYSNVHPSSIKCALIQNLIKAMILMYVIKDNFTYVLITIHNDMHMSHIYAMLEHQDVSFQRDLLLLLTLRNLPICSFLY